MKKLVSVSQVRDMVINLDSQDLISDLDNIEIKPSNGRISFILNNKAFDFGYWAREDLIKSFLTFVNYVRSV